MKVETWKVEDVIPYIRNPRKNENAVLKVAASIKEYGWRQPIVVDKEGVVIAGHTRLLAAKHLKLKEVPVHVALDMNPVQAKAYRLADNRVAQESEWDTELLALEIEELGELGLSDLDALGFDEDELANLRVSELEEVEGLTDPDEVPEAPEDPTTKPGDLWILGNHRLLCGDSNDITAIDRLLDGSAPDAIITDPPYGIGIDGQKKSVCTNPKYNRKAHDFKGWDSQRPDAGIFNYILSLNIPALIWGGNYFADLLPASRGWIYWSKGQDGLSMSDGELAWTNNDKVLRSVTVNRGAINKDGSVHPTQKPCEVIEFSLDYLDAGKVVLDIFGGSGTTLIACEKTARDCRMMEIDPAYVDVIVKRWEDFTGKKAVLANG